GSAGEPRIRRALDHEVAIAQPGKITLPGGVTKAVRVFGDPSTLLLCLLAPMEVVAVVSGSRSAGVRSFLRRPPRRELRLRQVFSLMIVVVNQPAKGQDLVRRLADHLELPLPEQGHGLRVILVHVLRLPQFFRPSRTRTPRVSDWSCLCIFRAGIDVEV